MTPVRPFFVQRNRTTPQGTEKPRDATWCRETARRHIVQRDSATLQRAAKPRDARDRATLRGGEGRTMLQRAEKPCDATWCRQTTRRHVVQRDRSTPRVAEKPRDATLCRGTARRCNVHINRVMAETARHHVVQRDQRDATSCRDLATSRRAEGPRDATACRGKSCKLKSFCDRDVDRSTTGRFGPASGRTGPALPIPPLTRRRRTDSEYTEC